MASCWLQWESPLHVTADFPILPAERFDPAPDFDCSREGESNLFFTGSSMRRLMGIVPTGIALTVLVFVWSPPYSGFGAPPLFFRVFASFIAFGFLLIGGGLLFGNLDPRSRLRSLVEETRRLQDELHNSSPASGLVGNYSCSSCGAPLGDTADVSPHGDVKCAHCGRWFNIHQSSV